MKYDHHRNLRYPHLSTFHLGGLPAFTDEYIWYWGVKLDNPVLKTPQKAPEDQRAYLRRCPLALLFRTNKFFDC